MEKRKIWMRQPSEISEAWEAFNLYINMPRVSEDPTQKRTLANVAERTGKHINLISKWSGNNGWVERSRAFDDDKALVAFDAQVVDLARYQREVLRQESEELHLLAELLRGSMVEAREMLIANDPEHPLTIQRIDKMLDATDKLAKMRRRLANLPTVLVSGKAEDKGDDPNEPAREFVIGGSN